MFKAFGHEKSSILDGGLPRWEAEGYPLENNPPTEVENANYPTPLLNTDTIKGERTALLLFSPSFC